MLYGDAVGTVNKISFDIAYIWIFFPKIIYIPKLKWKNHTYYKKSEQSGAAAELATQQKYLEYLNN